jgi:polyferredoxin
MAAPLATRSVRKFSVDRIAPRARGVQKLRFWAQSFSLGINVWIGVQFYLWVKYIESQGTSWAVTRPPGVEGWLPIGSLVSLRYWWNTGIVNEVHPAGLIIFAVIVGTAFLFKKGFCSWVCPIGFVSETVGDIADRLWGRRLVPPRWLDYPLRTMKYLLLAFFIWAVLIAMTPASVKSFVDSDYNIMTDILMLRFFTDISIVALGVITALFLLSFLIRGFWCRYLCPYGALLGILSLVSPTRIRRNHETCIDCAACSKACPAFIKVDTVREVVSDECIGCMACVNVCPVNKTLEVKVASKRWTIPTLRWATMLLIAFWITLLGFTLFGPWQNGIADQQYMERIDQVNRGEYVYP